MKARALLAGAGLALGLVVLTRGAGPGSRRTAPPDPPVAPASPGAADPSPAGVPAFPDRNPFAYAGAEPGLEPAPPDPTPPEAAPAPAEPAPPEPIRLVGFLRRAGEVKAVLAVQGEIALLGPGESAGGYAVLSVDEDSGVRIRDAAGAEALLRPPP